jgi:acyl-coenzyme A thioesterase PaaI-like protein
MDINTHLKIDNNISGECIELKKDYAKVKLTTKEFMCADSQGLIHGGFIFSSADYSAMLAINDPHVVLAKSNTKFIAPVKLNDIVILEANVLSSDGFKSEVEVIAKVEQKDVFKGSFFTATLKKHIFDV